MNEARLAQAFYSPEESNGVISINLEGHRILVTGAASGLGEAFTFALAKAGAVVVAADINESALKNLTDRVAEIGGKAVGVLLDVTARSACAELARKQLDEPITGLVNSAGILLPSRIDADDAGLSWDRMLAVNCTGTFNVTTAFFEHLRRTRGSILNLSSAAATSGRNKNVSYQASKAAISQLTRGWAVEFAEHGIRVNALAPGPILTPLTAPTRNDPERSQRILSRVPFARFGLPSEVAAAGVFLLSSYAKYITGAVLPVDGGAGAN